MKFSSLSRKAVSGFLALAVVTLSVQYLAAGSPAQAAGGTMYFAPQTVMTSGSDWSVQVRVDTGGQAVNAVQSDFTYPTGKLTFVSIDGAGSSFDVAASGTGGSGSVSIARGATGTPRNGDLLVATVKFHVIATGATALTLQNSSALVESAGSTDILTTKTNGSYTSIAGPLNPVYRLANWITKERLFTTSAAERDNAVNNLPGWVSEGTSFEVVPSGTSGSVPVYRLANWMTKERLFTTSAAERDNAVNNLPGWVSEGTSFNVVSGSTSGAVPVYRLANWKTKERLFTLSAAEKDNAVASLPGWVYDGVAFYTAP